MDITELLKKFGTIREIPADELAAAGYELRRAPDGARYLHRRDAEDPADKLRRKLAHVLGVPESLFAGRSLHFLNRLVLVLDEEVGRVFTDGEGKVVEGRLLDGRVLDGEDIYRSFDLMVCMLRAKAKGELAQLRQSHSEAADTLAELSGLGIKLDVWTDGIGERFMDSEDGAVATEADFLARVGQDLHQGLETFRRLDAKKFRGCLKELASHLRAKAELESILQAASAERKASQLAAATALKRLAGVKTASGDGLGVAQFHLKRALELLKSGPADDEDMQVFRASWSRKDPLDDLLIGNDAGCCIGVYGADDEFGGAPGKKMIPAMLFDPATRFIELWSGDQRVGLALCFAGHLDGSPVLVVNSIELSGRVAGHPQVLAELALGYAVDLAEAAGFKSVVMGNHGYNTGVSHGRDEWLGPPVKGIVKVHHLTRHVHGDVFIDDDVDGDENEPPQGLEVFGVSEVILPSPTSARTLVAVSAWDEKGILTFAQAREICEVVIAPDKLWEHRAKKHGIRDRLIPPWRHGEASPCGYTLQTLGECIRRLTGSLPVRGSRSRVALLANDYVLQVPDGIYDDEWLLQKSYAEDMKIRTESCVYLLTLDTPLGEPDADGLMNHVFFDVVAVLDLLEALAPGALAADGGDAVGIDCLDRRLSYSFRGKSRGVWMPVPEHDVPAWPMYVVSVDGIETDEGDWSGPFYRTRH